MHFELAFVLLFSIATAVAIAARDFKLPYTVALAGLGVGVVYAFEPPHLTKDAEAHVPLEDAHATPEAMAS